MVDSHKIARITTPHFLDQIPIRSKFAKCSVVPRSSLESRHRPTGGRWFTVQISTGPKIKVGSRDLGL